MTQVASEFVERTREWSAQLERDEWFFAKLREELVGALPATLAYEAITDVGHLVIELPDSYLKHETAELLLALARKSDTTTMPAGLARVWDSVTKQLSTVSPSTLTGLRSWYRVTAP